MLNAGSNGWKNVCPTGWHVPTDAEWTTLTTYLGGESIAGGKLKETGTSHWLSPNTVATNETGFTALPGGVRNSTGAFDQIGYWGSWQGSPTVSLTLSIEYYSAVVYRNNSLIKSNGYSVRCVKDN